MTEQAPDIDVETKEEEQQQSSKHACDRCGKSFANNSGLWKHKKTCGSGVKEAVKPDEATQPKKQPTKRPTPAPKRVPLDDTLGGLYGVIGSSLMPQVSVLAARGMVLQAPAAGAVLDKLIAGTFVDKAAQKYAGKAKDAKGVGALLGLPVLLFAIEKQPAMLTQPAIQQMLRSVVKENLVGMIAAKAKEQADDRKIAEMAAEVGMELTQTAPDGTKIELVDQLIGELLEPLFRQGPPQEPDDTASEAA